MSEPRRSGRPEPEGATSDEAQVEGDDEQAAVVETEATQLLDLFGRPYERPQAFPVEKSGDPLGGHPIDETMRFWWSGRRKKTFDDDGIPTAVPDDPAPVSRSPLRERFSAVRTRYFPLPDEVIPTYLGSGETLLHYDHPSLRFFVVSNLGWFLALLAVAGAAIYCFVQGWAVAAAALYLVLVVIVVILAFKRMGERYTTYVITNARMIRMAGIVSRKIESIPWVRVTDVGFEQTALERLLGYATLNIESANETMGLRKMRGIADPVTFNHHLMDMVVAKQGPTTPLGRRSEYNILQEDRGLFGRRRKRAAARRRLILDDANPEMGTEGPPTDPADFPPGTIGSGSTAATPGGGAGADLGPGGEGDSSDI